MANKTIGGCVRTPCPDAFGRCNHWIKNPLCVENHVSIHIAATWTIGYARRQHTRHRSHPPSAHSAGNSTTHDRRSPPTSGPLASAHAVTVTPVVEGSSEDPPSWLLGRWRSGVTELREGAALDCGSLCSPPASIWEILVSHFHVAKESIWKRKIFILMDSGINTALFERKRLKNVIRLRLCYGIESIPI